MAVEPKPNESPGQDDSWEKLAENLFGINFQKSSDERDVPPPPVARPTPPPAPFDSFQTAGDEPASAEELPAVPVPAAVESSASDGAGPPDDEPTAVSDSDSSAEPDKEADTFWDALNEWDWDDEAKSAPTSKKEPAERSPARERPKRAQPPVSPRYEDSAVSGSAADFRDEYVDDPDFGLGLLKDEAVTPTTEKALAEPPSSTTAPLADAESTAAPTADTEQDAAPAKRRRRRRRRRPARAAATETSSEETRQGDDVNPDQVDEKPEIEESVAADPADSSQDEPRSSRRPGRRRSSRRHRTPSEETKSETPDEEQPSAVELVDTDQACQQPTEAQEAATDEGESSSRKIPTWEEAISYLLHKQPSEKSGGDTRASAGKKPSKSTSGRSAGRRRRQ